MDLQAFNISLDTSMLPPPALQIKRKTTEDEDDAIQDLLASWDRDDASLSASEALQLIEGVEGAPPSPDSSHTINNSRARQRREIKQLREQRAALEATIRRLWSVADDALSRTDGYASVMRWKLAADEQRDRLKQAQYENAQLKRRIAELKQMVKGLKLTLRRRVAKNTVGAVDVDSLWWRLAAHAMANVCVNGDTVHVRVQFIRETLRLPPTSVVQPAKVTLSAEESAKVRSLVADLDRMRAKAASNTLFLSHEAATTSDSFLTWRVRSDSAHSCCSFEIAASEEIPYRKDAVDQALYAFRRQLRPDCLSFVAQVRSCCRAYSLVCHLLTRDTCRSPTRHQICL